MSLPHSVERGGMADFPRRQCIDLLTPEELAIREIVDKVEALGAHPLLTETVILLGQAKDKLADYLEGA